MDKIELLKALIAKETDEKELEKLNDQLIEAIREQEREKVKKELEEKLAQEKAKLEAEKKELEIKSKQANADHSFAAGRIVVGPGEYKGYSLRAVMDSARRKMAESPYLKKLVPKIDSRGEAFERVAKMFVDIYDNAIKSPAGLVAKAPMAEGTGSLGGYLVPTEERMELLSYIREVSLAMQYCTHVPMSTDSMTLPRELTKVNVAFTSEASQATESDPTFDQVTLTATRLDAYTIASNELIQDTQIPGGIVGVLMSQFIEAIGQKIDSAVFIGTGTPVSGVFLNAGVSQVFNTGSTAFSALTEADLRAIIGKIPASRLGNARWYVHRSPLWTYVYGLKDSQNRPLFIPSMTEGAPHMLYGYPVEQPEQAPSTSAAGTGFIVFGDLRGFYIGDRLTNISLFVDPYSKSTYYQTLFLMFTRWGFAHALPGYYGRIVTAAS